MGGSDRDQGLQSHTTVRGTLIASPPTRSVTSWSVRLRRRQSRPAGSPVAAGSPAILRPVREARHPGGSVPCAHMPRAARITSADLLRAGWTTSRQSGSHVILVHPERAGARVVVPVHADRILKPKTLAAILTSAEIASDELQGLLS